MKYKVKMAMLLAMVLVFCSFSAAFASSNVVEPDKQEVIIQPMYVPCPSCGSGMLVHVVGGTELYSDGRNCVHGCVDALDIVAIFRHEEYDQCTSCGYIQDREWVIEKIRIDNCLSFEHSPSCPFGD